MELEKYWKAIQDKICIECIDGDSNGNCQLLAGDECALKKFLPQIILTIANVHSDSYEAYVNKLRRNVCILCNWELSDMSCEKRNDLTCALERYYPQIIEIVKSVRAELKASRDSKTIT